MLVKGGTDVVISFDLHRQSLTLTMHLPFSKNKAFTFLENLGSCENSPGIQTKNILLQSE